MVHSIQQKQRDQCSPNLDAQSVLDCAGEAFHGQVLLERLEAQFYLPEVLVDRGDGGRAELQVVGEQIARPLLVGIPDQNAAQQTRAIGLCLGAREPDDLVEDFGYFTGLALLGDLEGAIDSACP